MEVNNIQTITGAISIDDRGSVRYVNDFNFTGVKRFYQVENHRQGFIRAWHAHKKEAKYIYVPAGTALIGAVPLPQMVAIQNNSLLVSDAKIFKTVLSSKKPQIIFIPPGYANGFKTLECNTTVLFFSTSTLEESLGDDIRFNYDLVNIWGEEYR